MEIRLNNVSKIFSDKKKEDVRAVDNVSLTFSDGKLVGLLGPSGCGKSTMLYVLAGLHLPSEGTVFFGKDDVTKVPPEQRGIGLVFQNYALYPHMTVRQNIMFPLENMKELSKAEANERALATAKLVNIDQLMDRKPKQLSGGQQQRVAIARALVKYPKVLLLDEPLSNLDARLRLQTREEIKRIQRETGITTVFVTHDQEEAMSISDEIIVMNSGQIQQIGKPQEVYDNPVNLFVAKFLGTPQINTFDGHIQSKKIDINGHVIGEVNAENQEVVVAIRSEFFVLDEKGVMPALVDFVESVGKDKYAVCYMCDEKKTSRIIVPVETKIEAGDKVFFNHKRMFVFNKETGKRVM